MPVTAYATHEDYIKHNLPGHPERAARLESIWKVFDEHHMLDDLLVLDVNPASVEQAALVHRPAYIQAVQKAAQEGGGMLDADTYLLPVSYDVALLSLGGVLSVIDSVISGTASNGLAAVRPPGHHALPMRAMGFCIFSNVAVAAKHAQTYDGIDKVMIADFDVHHGNGTQAALYNDPSVLFISSHQYPFYPGSGAINEIGEGEGRGTTINIPLRSGTGNEGLFNLYKNVLWPAARRFDPDLILVSAGFDAHWADPLANLQLDLQGFTHLSRELIAMANQLCDGKIVFVLEGGYDLEVVSHGMLNAAYALQEKDQVIDPLGSEGWPGKDVDNLVKQLIKLHQLDV